MKKRMTETFFRGTGILQNSDMLSESDVLSKEEKKESSERRESDILNERSDEDSGLRCITIIGQVEGHTLLPENQKTTKYEHIIPALVSFEQDKRATGLLVLLNTVGGDVEAGLAIAEMIASLSKPTASLVLGGGHSIGVPLAVSARRSFIVPTATMTIHPARINGTVIGAPQTYLFLERVQKRIVSFIRSHSSVSEKRLLELMMVPDEMATDIGTVLDGRQAVEEGIIDCIGGVKEAMSFLDEEVKRQEKGI